MGYHYFRTDGRMKHKWNLHSLTRFVPWASTKYLEGRLRAGKKNRKSSVQWSRHAGVDWWLLVGRHESLPTPQTLLSYKAKFKTTWGRAANLSLSGPRQSSIITRKIVAEKNPLPLEKKQWFILGPYQAEVCNCRGKNKNLLPKTKYSCKAVWLPRWEGAGILK